MKKVRSLSHGDDAAVGGVSEPPLPASPGRGGGGDSKPMPPNWNHRAPLDFDAKNVEGDDRSLRARPMPSSPVRPLLRHLTTGALQLSYEGGMPPFRPHSPADDLLSPRSILRRKSKEQYQAEQLSLSSSSFTHQEGDGSSSTSSSGLGPGALVGSLAARSSSRADLQAALTKIMTEVSGADKEATAQRIALLQPRIVPLLPRLGQCPWPGCRLVVGTSSACRKDVLSLLGWRVSAFLSPSIDEKAVGDRSREGPTASALGWREIAFEGEIEMEAEAPRGLDLNRVGALPLAVALAKAEAIRLLLQRSNDDDDDDGGGGGGDDDYTRECVFLTADQVIDYRGAAREKPGTADEAAQFLRSYSNDRVSVVNALVLTHYPSMLQVSSLDAATVHWMAIPEPLVQQTVQKGAVMYAAGGFTIEDPLLWRLVERIDPPGAIDSVLGLNVRSLHRSMAELFARVQRHSPRKQAESKAENHGHRGGSEKDGDSNRTTTESANDEDLRDEHARSRSEAKEAGWHK